MKLSVYGALGCKTPELNNKIQLYKAIGREREDKAHEMEGNQSRAK